MAIVSKILELTTLSEPAKNWLQKHAEHFTFKKGELVLQAGKVCSYLYYVQSGMLGAYYLHDGLEVCNWLALEHDFATSYYSFIARRPSYESIECFENCRLEAISWETLQQFYTLYPESERAGRLLLEDYYSRLEERLISIQFRTAKERYQLLTERRPDIIRRAPLGRIASYLGMKQETLSRIRAER